MCIKNVFFFILETIYAIKMSKLPLNQWSIEYLCMTSIISKSLLSIIIITRGPALMNHTADNTNRHLSSICNYCQPNQSYLDDPHYMINRLSSTYNYHPLDQSYNNDPHCTWSVLYHNSLQLLSLVLPYVSSPTILTSMHWLPPRRLHCLTWCECCVSLS